MNSPFFMISEWISIETSASAVHRGGGGAADGKRSGVGDTDRVAGDAEEGTGDGAMQPMESSLPYLIGSGDSATGDGDGMYRDREFLDAVENADEGRMLMLIGSIGNSDGSDPSTSVGSGRANSISSFCGGESGDRAPYPDPAELGD